MTTEAAQLPPIKITEFRLENGLRVVLHEDHSTPIVAVNIWYHVGSKNEVPGRTGFAHLFEHMMFQGSKHHDSDYFGPLQEAGGTLNGSTNTDRTNYYDIVPSNFLELALWLESDRMGYLPDAMTIEKLNNQRDVVKNEKRQNYDNRPYGPSGLRLCDLLFPKPHPYYECVIGDITDIQQASVEDVRQFFQTWYGPQNASLAIVGDFEPKAARALVERYFGPIPRGPEVQRADVPQPAIGRLIKETLEDKLAEVPRLILAWKGVRQYTDEEPAGDVLSDVLGSGRTARLYKRLVFEKHLASGVSASNVTLGMAGWFQITITAASGHTLDEIRPLVSEILVEVQQAGATEQEVERAKRNIIANRLRTVERIGGFGGKADLLNNYEVFLDDPGYLPRDIARYRAVTPQAVQAFAKKYLIPAERIELDVVPMPKKTASAQGERR
jgi:predicted Zn-dependent peptidase